jgi:6-phosphogluconolactonase
MACTALLDPASVPAENRHRMVGEATDLEAAAADYAELLADRLPSHDGVPRFDLILLGIGTDGHTASLFPNTPGAAETERFVVANQVPQLHTTRLTITFPVINAARQVWFLVTGAEKSEILRRIVRDRDPALPASRVAPVDGRCLWLVDQAAAWP